MSKITVTTIAGATSGADANKVKIESGDELNVVNGDLTVDTDTLFVDASADKVGINQASPTYQLSVLGSTQSTVEIESASTTGESRLYMTDPDSTGVGEIGYYHNGDTMRFNTGGAERMRLSSAGLHIGGTGAANALDDYEEGTHQTAITMGTSGTVTLNTSFDRISYTKIGRLVTINGNPRISSVSSPVGSMSLSLPFAAASGQTDENRAGGAIKYYDNSGGNGSYIKLMGCNVNEGLSTLSLNNTHTHNQNVTPAASDEIYLSFSYITA